MIMTMAVTSFQLFQEFCNRFGCMLEVLSPENALFTILRKRKKNYPPNFLIPVVTSSAFKNILVGDGDLNFGKN